MITVITHTRFDRPELLERCKKSVEIALPEGGKHLIIECPDSRMWARKRVLDAKEHDIIAFVDDDDFIHPNSLKYCLAALEQSGLGSACTDEVEVDIDGNIIRYVGGKKTYIDSTVHPRVIHHLCVMRGKFIDERAIEFHNRFDIGIDWFIRESVVLQHGCIHVPIDGYYWTQHSEQHTNSSRIKYMYSIREMQKLIRETWSAKFKGALPVFDISFF